MSGFSSRLINFEINLSWKSFKIKYEKFDYKKPKPKFAYICVFCLLLKSLDYLELLKISLEQRSCSSMNVKHII